MSKNTRSSTTTSPSFGFSKYFTANGYASITADNGSEAVSLARESAPDR